MLDGRDWYSRPGASREVLDSLREAARVDLPDSYYALLALSNGGEGPLPTDPFNLCLDTAEEVIDAVSSPRFEGFLVFGGNGGGELLAFDINKPAPFPIVTIDMAAGVVSAKQVAPTFDAFVNLIGRSA